MTALAGPVVEIHLGDGQSHAFHATWLRENSPDSDNTDPITGHRLQVAAFLPADLTVVDLVQRDGHVHLRFNDGHACAYPLAALQAAVEQLYPSELIGARELWGQLDPLPWHDLGELQSNPENILAFLGDVARTGLALVRGLPIEDDGLLRLTDLLGHIRWTNSGGIADVKSIAEAYDLSMTPRGLEPHVDNPYRIPQPGYTMLHCLRNDAEGGESILIDGFHVAEQLRAERPDLFEVLCNVPVVFRYADEQAILENVVPFIETWPDGRLKQTRFHGRADRTPAVAPDILERFYEARRAYAKLIWSDANQLRFKLAPGEMYFADNFRLFHGRQPFTLESGVRHMRQGYLDRDVVSSRQKTLLRDITAKPWKPRA